MRLLVVEDEKKLNELITKKLKRNIMELTAVLTERKQSDTWKELNMMQ